MAVKTGNEQLRDSMVAHQIGLLRLSGSINNRIIQLLDATEADLKDRIERALNSLVDGNPVDVTLPNVLKKLKALQDSIGEIRGAAMNDALDEWNSQMRDLSVAEPAFTLSKIHAAMPIILDMALPSPATLRALVSKQPFRGQTMKQWADQLAEADQQRIMNEIRIGLIEGQSIADIARRIVGSAQYDGVDGATQITRNNAEAITRTAVNFFSNAARQEFFEANADVFTEELYVATLDSRTTPICRSLDGKHFPVGKGPIPPLHWNCRSLRIAIVTDQPIGERPFNSSTEDQLLDEFTADNNLGSVSSRDNLPHGTKGKFDEFARKRTRQLIGQTPASTTYQEFLRNQSATFQDDVLGVAKGKLFRKGGLTLDRFVDRNGKELTLKQLLQNERDAFRKAGLDPNDYL
jgi:SPP1 gp7 family putative phage head morphogenesis protein